VNVRPFGYRVVPRQQSALATQRLIHASVGSNAKIEMTIRKTEDIKKEMIEKLGEDFGSLVYAIRNEVTWLTFKWIEFSELFGTKETRIELLNQSAPFFFFTIQKVLWDNLILGIAILTDPIESNGKKNITLKAIPFFISDANFRKEIERDIKELNSESNFCRDRRNKIIAHMDYNFGIDLQNAKVLEPATREKLRSTIERIQSIYNKIELKYLGRTVGYKYLTSHRGAISLLHTIESGIRFEEQAYEKRKRGDDIDYNYTSKI
jgi:hypothetical protein